MMLLSEQSGSTKSHNGSTERTLKSFLSAFSKSSRMSTLLDVYFLLKHLSNKVLYDREIWVYGAINRQTMSETR